MTSTNGATPGLPSGGATTGGTATKTRGPGASFGTASNYSRMLTTFPGAPVTAPTNWKQQPDGNWWSWDGATWHLQPQGPPPAPPAAGRTATFTADGALNKAGLLGLMALVIGAVAYVAHLPLGAAWVTMFVGLGVGIWCSFQPRRAPVLAPVYAVAEGVVLGVISRFYADQGAHVVTLAVFGTVAVVVGVWAVYRTGLVKVGNRFLQVTLVAGLGMIVVMVTAMITGWGLSGTGGLIIFGVLYLILAVMNLFVDFSFVDRAEQAGISADAEWFSAFTILVSSVMVYLALLRIFGGSR
jgi:uncharacterized YccA/Bax inhibitor family protein